MMRLVPGVRSSRSWNLSRRLFTTNKTSESSVESFKPVYIHPLSQIVLQHLTQVHHKWLLENQLQDRLTIHRDGTFEIDFPDTDGAVRIWTTYDSVDKKHWLAYRTADVQHRFMIQDNLMSAWHGNKRQSIPERVRTSVDELIKTADAAWLPTKRNK